MGALDEAVESLYIRPYIFGSRTGVLLTSGRERGPEVCRPARWPSHPNGGTAVRVALSEARYASHFGKGASMTASRAAMLTLAVLTVGMVGL